jgi:hypothetical protein
MENLARSSNTPATGAAVAMLFVLVVLLGVADFFRTKRDDAMFVPREWVPGSHLKGELAVHRASRSRFDLHVFALRRYRHRERAARRSLVYVRCKESVGIAPSDGGGRSQSVL